MTPEDIARLEDAYAADSYNRPAPETVDEALAFWKGLTIGLASSLVVWFGFYALLRGWAWLLGGWWSLTGSGS
jgi:hypothetical protein